MRFYELAVLRRGKNIAFGPDGELYVELDCSDASRRVTNDHELTAACGEGIYFFVSGGGSLLFENRFLLIVRRDAHVRVNPGQWSLFTGRAEGPNEWANPKSLARELFEELDILVDGLSASYSCPKFGEEISLGQAERRLDANSPELPIAPVSLPGRLLTVEERGRTLYSEPAFWHVNHRGDINVIHLFSCELPLNAISARDSERSAEGGGRIIGALDVQKMLLYSVGPQFKLCEGIDATTLLMSAHLLAVVIALRGGVQPYVPLFGEA